MEAGQRLGVTATRGEALGGLALDGEGTADIDGFSIAGEGGGIHGEGEGGEKGVGDGEGGGSAGGDGEGSGLDGGPAGAQMTCTLRQRVSEIWI